ncbi:KOW motif-containing protein, partial [Streptococcus pluranimalium]
PLFGEESRATRFFWAQTGPVFDPNIKAGGVVKIIDGAFMGQVCRVMEVDGNKVKLMINMFGTETQADL